MTTQKELHQNIKDWWENIKPEEKTQTINDLVGGVNVGYILKIKTSGERAWLVANKPGQEEIIVVDLDSGLNANEMNAKITNYVNTDPPPMKNYGGTSRRTLGKKYKKHIKKSKRRPNTKRRGSKLRKTIRHRSRK